MKNEFLSANSLKKYDFYTCVTLCVSWFWGNETYFRKLNLIKIYFSFKA